MRVVHEEITFQCAGGEVVDAACAVGYVTHDHRLHTIAERLQDVGDGGGKEEETLGHLQGYALATMPSDRMHGLVELEVVVFGEEGRDRGVEFWVVED